MAIPDSFDYFSQNLKGPSRDQLLFIAGCLSPFDDLFDTYAVNNQEDKKVKDTMDHQSIIYIYSYKDIGPLHEITFTIGADGSVLVEDSFSWDDESEGRTVESYTMSLNDLFNWLRSQPPKWNRFAKFVE